jgi:hypothetical protein
MATVISYGGGIQTFDHWVRHKQYDRWQDALRASAILVSHDERGEA